MGYTRPVIFDTPRSTSYFNFLIVHLYFNVEQPFALLRSMMMVTDDDDQPAVLYNSFSLFAAIITDEGRWWWWWCPPSVYLLRAIYYLNH